MDFIPFFCPSRVHTITLLLLSAGECVWVCVCVRVRVWVSVCIAPRLKEIIKIITAAFFMKFVEVANKLLSKTKTRKKQLQKIDYNERG